VDWPSAVARAQRIVHGCADPKPERLVAHGAHLVFGEARLLDAHTVEAAGERITADHIVIATGRRPPRPPIPGIEHAVTHVEALAWTEPPRRLAVIGGGVIGMEFAYLFRRVGSEVRVFETLDHILYMLDGDVRDTIAQHAIGLGIGLHTAARVLEIARMGDERRLRVHVGSGQIDVTVDQVLVAAGQAPAVDGLGLEAIGVTFDRGGIETDATLRTTVPTVWAAGDVRKGAPALSQVASHEGALAARNALTGAGREIAERIVPFLIGLTPPAAGVGLTEAQARTLSPDVGVHHQTYAEVCPAANVDGEPEGFVKVIFEASTGKLLGAQAFGARSPELMQQFAFALHAGMTLGQAAEALFVFPGISEVLWYALRPRPGDQEGRK
jgi:pyruvate/2-oxoglutarate dehydrogenase complex dihydrolipoamide dehydrogenase (E3) component